MLYPRELKTKLGLDTVIESGINLCETQQGRKIFHALKFSTDSEQIKLWLAQTNEMKDLLEKGQLTVSVSLDFDIQKDKANTVGFFYEIDVIQSIYDFLGSSRKVQDFLSNHSKEYPTLSQLYSDVDIDYAIISEIEKVVARDGEIKSTASKALSKIINEIKRAEQSILKSGNTIFNSSKDKGLLADTELSIKNGRVVLPVLSEHKRKVNGILIDQSGTGKISYIEPMELVNLNNELSELYIKKRHEVIVILRALTKKVVLNLRGISIGMQRFTVFDFVRAKARLAIDWKSIYPTLSNETDVINARHPILQERLKEEKNAIVPLDYNFTEEHRLIVISGPNAGGKSVALKTIGLLQYMIQTGFLVPCDAESKFQIVDNLFVDIGDNQSIESDLSTYSSHLKAAKHIINFCDANTLVLMDEIGTGTDPMFGGPMAEAILETIQSKKALGVITTHFSNIKSKAEKLEGVRNAAMLFDTDKLQPLYKLQIGQPGSSFVYEVASNIGLNKKLIKRAKQLTNTKQYDLDVLLAEVQTSKEQIKEKQAELTTKTKHAHDIEKEYRNLKSTLDTQRIEILGQAKSEANAIIDNANKSIEKTIREIKEVKADKEKTKKIREKYVASKSDEQIVSPEIFDFKVGDQVQLINTDAVGEIVEIKKKKATVQVGSLVTKTDLSNLRKVGAKTEKKIKKYISSTSFNKRQESFKAEKDIRGQRTHEMLPELDQWIDSAIILGVGSLRVLHGKGNGILSKEIRRHFKGHSAIASIEYERVDLGGQGISIITLK